MFLITISSITELIGLISAGVALIGSLITVIVKLVSAIKTIAKNKDWQKVIEIAKAAILEAEKSMKSGKEKKEMVINIVNKTCLELGVEVDANKLADYIDECIKWANELNK